MKGEMFNLLEEFIISQWGVPFYEDLYHSVHTHLTTKEPFVGPGTYPDNDFITILTKACSDKQIDLGAAAESFGEFCFPLLAKKIPVIMSTFHSLEELLSGIDSVIHVEVRKLYSDAITPKFSYTKNGENSLSLIYTSKRNFPTLVVGLIKGAASYYNCKVAIKHTPIDELLAQHQFDVTIEGIGAIT